MNGEPINGVRIDVFRAEHAAAFEALNRACLVDHGLYEAPDEAQLSNPWEPSSSRAGKSSWRSARTKSWAHAPSFRTRPASSSWQSLRWQHRLEVKGSAGH